MDQDRGMGRYTVSPCTTKRRATTNLKTKNNQNCQKIELYGSLTTRELKKKHSSRLVGGAEMGSRGEEDVWQDGSWWTGRFHIHVQISLEEQLGSEADHATQGSSARKIKPHNL